MTFFEETLHNITTVPISILDTIIPLTKYTLLDLSTMNTALTELNMADADICQSYIDTVLIKKDASVAYGGYLEQRGLYATNSHFNKEGAALRNIHLGVDFWAVAGTKILTPISGKVHSFMNNDTKGDYGPTIILSHNVTNIQFYTLYGHLSLESLNGLYINQEFSAGEVIGSMGTPEINVNYAPHLHFQLINDIGAHKGNYPGVCTANDMEYFADNCPNPKFLLKV
ncbi:MAG: peptidase M23 [Flavobacteriaceae bacterium]|nr:MAG: peptidase M23 [Flavobacteriaceae bacterium]